MENIEQYAFWSAHDSHLFNLKKDILRQISHLNISITASDFFTIDRRFLSGVSMMWEMLA